MFAGCDLDGLGGEGAGLEKEKMEFEGLGWEEAVSSILPLEKP